MPLFPGLSEEGIPSLKFTDPWLPFLGVPNSAECWPWACNRLEKKMEINKSWGKRIEKGSENKETENTEYFYIISTLNTIKLVECMNEITVINKLKSNWTDIHEIWSE